MEIEDKKSDDAPPVMEASENSTQVSTPVKQSSNSDDIFSTPIATPIRPDKENEANLSQLNLSGTLLTSYTPATPTRSSSRVRKTPSRFETPSAAPGSPVKSVLSESAGNSVELKTPRSSKKSMYLIDLTTPAPTAKTANVSSSKKKTPAVRNDNVLLKSALKNSTLKKTVEATPNRKALTFAENALNTTETSCYSSVIDVSSSSEATFKEALTEVATQSFSEVEGVKKLMAKEPNDDLRDVTGVRQLMKTPGKIKGPVNDLSNVSGVADLMKTPGVGESSDDEVKELIDSISSILDEDENKKSDMAPQEIEGTFQKIIDENPRSVESISGPEESLEREIFEAANKSEMESVDKVFDDLMGRPSITHVYSPAAKKPQEDVEVKERGEKVMKWIDSVRESLASETNQTEQVLSSRYSNVTPNTSIHAVNPAPYDVATPKVSILDTVEASKVKQLAMSPVTRLSVFDDNTEILENYQLKNVTKSLRSTRKQIGNAMASLHDLSTAADTTIDGNETMNADEVNQSQVEEAADILSLDVAASNNYIQFATGDDAGQETQKEIFEINSSNDNSVEKNEDLSESESESEDSDVEEATDEEEQAQEEEMLESTVEAPELTLETPEPTLEAAEPAMEAPEPAVEAPEPAMEAPEATLETPKPTPEAGKTVFPLKFRLSENDMEDGINQLDDSRTEDIEELMVEEHIEESVEKILSQESMNENGGDDVEIPETQQMTEEVVEEEKQSEDDVNDVGVAVEVEEEITAPMNDKEEQENNLNASVQQEELDETFSSPEQLNDTTLGLDQSEVVCGNQTQTADQSESVDYNDSLASHVDVTGADEPKINETAQDLEQSEVVDKQNANEISDNDITNASLEPQSQEASSVVESVDDALSLDGTNSFADILSSQEANEDEIPATQLSDEKKSDEGELYIPETQQMEDDDIDIPQTQQPIEDEDVDIAQTQNIDDSEISYGEEEKLDETTADDSIVNDSQIPSAAPNRDTTMFSDTEFSHVEINENLLGKL